jgi:ADP-ribosylglycohydrolase
MENMEDFCVSYNYTQRDFLLIHPSSSSSSNSSSSCSSHAHPRATAAAATAAFLLLLRRRRSSSSNITSVEIPPKHENQKQNETHYENITH